MILLQTLQQRFVDVVLSGFFEDMSDLLASPSNRLQIYRNNIFGTLTKSLKNTYPACVKWVGEKYFNALANRYISKNLNDHGHRFDHLKCDLSLRIPSCRSGPSKQSRFIDNNAKFCEEFQNFLLDFEPAKDIPSLVFLARFEWQIERLSIINQEENAYLFYSDYEVDKIWSLCLSECSERFEHSDHSKHSDHSDHSKHSDRSDHFEPSLLKEKFCLTSISKTPLYLLLFIKNEDVCFKRVSSADWEILKNIQRTDS